jgi:hypothetical protein
MQQKHGFSRLIDRALWTKVDENVIKEAGNQPPAERAENWGPKPVLTPVVENCIKKKDQDVSQLNN